MTVYVWVTVTNFNSSAADLWEIINRYRIRLTLNSNDLWNDEITSSFLPEGRIVNDSVYIHAAIIRTQAKCSIPTVVLNSALLLIGVTLSRNSDNNLYLLYSGRNTLRIKTLQVPPLIARQLPASSQKYSYRVLSANLHVLYSLLLRNSAMLPVVPFCFLFLCTYFASANTSLLLNRDRQCK